jgi:hypothetical protein
LEWFREHGNATIQLLGRPPGAVDRSVAGRRLLGSWALDHPLSAQQIENVGNSGHMVPHGHPDHLRKPSLDLLAKTSGSWWPTTTTAISRLPAQQGLRCDVLPYRQWHELEPNLRVMCIDNMNQDSILVIQAGDALLLNLNDSPVAGEEGFLRRLVAQHPNDKTYVFALCSVDADMFNFVDRYGRSLVRPPEERKPPEVWRVGRLAKRLGVRNFCCSSSQHVYARSSLGQSTPHHLGRHVQALEPTGCASGSPFATVDLAGGKSPEPSDAPTRPGAVHRCHRGR